MSDTVSPFDPPILIVSALEEARVQVRWLATGQGEPAVRKRTAHTAWRLAVRTGWIDGVRKIWENRWGDPATLIESAWPLVAGAGPGLLIDATPVPTTPVDPLPVSTTTAQPILDHPAVHGFLVDLTWGDACDPAHAKAQPNARIAALGAVTTRFDERRWLDVWAKGVPVRGAGGRNVLTRLIEQRFGVGACTTGWLMPNPEQAQALDRCLDRMLAARPPFPTHTHPVLALVHDPVLGTAARHHLLNWVKHLRHPSRLERAVEMAQHGLVVQTMRPPPDPIFVETLFQAWLTQGVPSTVTVRPKDLLPNRGVQHHFQEGNLRVTYDPARSAHGANADPEIYQASFATAMWSPSNAITDQTLNIAEHWFAKDVPDFRGMIVALTTGQREACLGIWRSREEAPKLRQVLEEARVTGNEGPRRPRSRL